MKRILVAGIGNIFLGDDAFGCEVVRQLSQRALPEEVQVVDFGIRSYDLSYAIAENNGVTILVDATPRGKPPGTVFLIEPELSAPGQWASPSVDAHTLDPVRVLQMAVWLGARPAHLYLVGCEPAVLETDEGQFGLSAPVQAAVPKAIEMIETVTKDFLSKNQNPRPGLVPA